jgi:hypothetical protein
MSVLEVQDHVPWPKDIRVNPPLRNQIVGLSAGALVALEIDDISGTACSEHHLGAVGTTVYAPSTVAASD